MPTVISPKTPPENFLQRASRVLYRRTNTGNMEPSSSRSSSPAPSTKVQSVSTPQELELLLRNSSGKESAKFSAVKQHKSPDNLSTTSSDDSNSRHRKTNTVQILMDDQQEHEDRSMMKEPLLKSSTTNTNTTGCNAWFSTATQARLLLLLASALYGSSFSVIKVLGETGMSIGLCASIRFGMAALVTLPWLLQVSHPTTEGAGDNTDATKTTMSRSTSTNSRSPITRNTTRRSTWRILFDPTTIECQATLGGMQVGLWDALGYVSQAVGLVTTSASKSSFLASLAVVIVPLLDLATGRPFATRQGIGAVLAAIGVGFLELGEDAQATTTSAVMEAAVNTDASAILPVVEEVVVPQWQTLLNWQEGDFASFLQAIAFGMGFWRMEWLMHKFPTQAGRGTAAQLLAVFLASLAYMFYTNLTDPEHTIPTRQQLHDWLTNPVILGSLVWTGLVTTAFTIYIETVALKTLSAAETVLIFSTEPLWGAAFAYLVVGERIGGNAVCGALLIMAGCIYSSLGTYGILELLLPWKYFQRVIMARRMEGLEVEKSRSSLQ